LRIISAAIIGLLVAGSAAGGTTSTLNAGQQATLRLWLDKHSAYRLATEADCECAEDLSELRTKSEGVWKARADFQPYLIAGDFRKNGHMSFAAVVVKRGSSKQVEGQLLIFDGPYPTSGKPPSYVGTVAPLLGAGLNMPPGSSWPVYGRYFSEGCYYKPSGRAYRRNCDSGF
jgi:hypothetical protein